MVNTNDSAPDVVRAARETRSQVFPNADWRDTLVILMYELGVVCRNLMYASAHPKLADGYRAYAKSELMDVITQCETLAQNFGWDFDELRADGAEKFLERMQEYERKSHQ